MRKTSHRCTRLAATGAVLTLLLGACGSDDNGQAGTTSTSGGAASSSSAPSSSALQSTTTTTSSTSTTSSSSALQPGEAEALLHLAEEEKLARDLYTAFLGKWGLAAWEQIAQAEATHLASMLQVLATHGLADPTAGHAAGEFTDPALQATYDTLIARGSASLVGALTASALVEETDIADLSALLETATPTDVVNVCTNLRDGSENHLRAFVEQLAKRDIVYQPVVLDQSTYDAILASETPTTSNPDHGSGSKQP